MSESTLKPFTGKLDENIDTNQQPALKPFTGALDGEKKGVMGHLKDTGLSALKGAVAVPELAVGIMDVMSDGATGKTLENKDGAIGFRPKEAKQALGDLHTDQYKAQQQEFADAGKDGNWVDKVVDKTKVALTNPSLIANTVVESVPSMLAGGVLGRALGIANPIVAGAVGEGAVMAGSQAEQIRQETVDGRLTADQSLAGVTTGVLGGLIGFAGGRLAQKMGIGDVDTMLVTGRAGPAEIAGEIASMPAKSLPRRVIEGAISEGFLEELPQSVSEQVIQNLALDKPWHDGIEDAAVMGTLAGMAMGGAANILSGHNTGTESQDNQQQSGSPNLPSAPSQSGSSSDSALTGEYIPRENVPQGDNQGRTAFVYDQPSMDADNLLNNNGFDYGSAATGNPVSPDTPPAPNGNYFDGDYGSEAAFDDLLNSVPPASQTPSQQMGINPNDGPMSSAAALAVDSGASPIAQLGYTPEQQTQEQSNTPISDVVPNDYRQLLGNHNEGQSFNTNFEDAAIQQGNAQSDNAGESISQQYDINTADEMAGEFEKNGTESAPQTKTTQPILGQDGKNKWFGSQEKAQAFLDKKNIGNDYQVVQDGKRFEIQPNVAQVQDGNQSQLKALEQQFEEAKTVPEKARIRKEINALQQGDNQPSAIENTISASENNISMPKNTILDAQNNIDKTQTNNVADQLAQLEQQFLDAKSVPQKAKLKKQIDQLKSQQTEMTTTPFSSEQIQKQYGDTAESVMSDIEILGDDFTIDLRDDNKKTNALNNPNYNAVQKADGSVEIVGMKHPSTGEWVGKKPNAISIDENAHQAATSSQNNTPEPTQAQIEAGNYKKGHIKVHGLDIAVENPRGSERRGTDPDGNEWSHNMSDHYGYIKRTIGADQEHIDTYVGKNPESENVFIVDQIDQVSGGFDEHKVMLGFDSQEEAITAYKSNFDKGWKVGPVTQMSKDQFKDWLKNSDTSKPVAESGKKTEPQYPVNKWQEEMNKALAKADPEHPSFKKLQANAKHGLKSVSDRASALRQAREIEKKLEAPKAEPKNPKASTNTIFTEDAAEKARALLRKKLGQLNAGIDPEILQAGITLAGYHIEKGARSFAAYAKAMTEDMGDLVKPYLKSWYMGVKFDPRAADFDGMSTSAEVENFDLNGDNNEQSASSNANTQGTSTVRGGRGRTSQSNAPQANNPNVETGVSTGSGTSNQNQSTGRSRIRDTGTDVENDGRVSGRGMESSRRKDASGTGQLSVDQPTRLESPAAVANTATDFYMADPDIIFGGSQKQRFDKNKKALELLEELNAEGRQATAEEQVVLASYTGWGSFGQDLFQGTWNTPVFKDGWKDENLWLREKLGKESWESAKDSVLNAFFTDPYTVQAMWSMAEKMGFTGGRVLEPAVGTGNFISLMPMHIKQRSQVTAIDLDITTAAIAKQLFPESNVQNMPYQKSKTPDNFYDLVISNVPFSNDVKIADRRYNQFNPNLHDYYFLKMLDQVRPGGIVMAITSSGTMDKQSEVIRREMGKQSELITSIRLPAGAFKDFAGTNVVTDIIVLRKRTEPLTMTPDADWIGLSEVKTSTKPVKVNSFYANNLRNVLGTIDYKGGDPRFAGMTVLSNGEAWLKKELSQLSDLVSENTLLPRHNDDYLTYYANKAGERTNTLTMSNGELMFVYGDQMVKATDLFEYKIKDAKKTAQRQKSIEDLVAIRKAYTDLTDAERIDQDNVEQLRKTLNKLYLAYTKEHGPLADSFGLQYFRKLSDAYYYSLAALEVNGKPAEILKRSVVRGAAALDNPTVSDAFVVERNKSAAPSLANIAKMAQVSEDQARAELLEKGAVYVLPNGDIMPSDMYLSGNVRQKLEEAQNAVAEGNTDLQRNVDALKEIIPEDIPYFNIEAKMGATWVPLSDYEKYIAHMLGMTDSNGITVTFPSGKWKVKLDPIAARRTEATTNYGSKYKSFQTVVSAALSNQNITVKYKNADGSESVDVQATEEVNEKISKIKEDFATWLWSDPERRVQLEKEYNHAFNAWATPKYDGSFMSMQGMALSLGNGPFNLRQHQQNAIWRAIVNRRSINAHEVGTGKTFTMGGIALESRRYGIAKKPLILAHNANSAAVAKEIQMMYPSARVLFISELGKAVRQIRMRQIANDDWDVVVMPHSMIDKLTLSEETLMAMAADDIAALEAELEEALAEEGGATLDEVLAMDSETVNKKMGFKNPTAKQLAKQRLKLLEDIQKQAMDSSKADAVNFEELGVDMIMVDEVHEFKKPSIATRMNMKGLNTSSNKRSVNLQLLTRYVRRMNNGGNVHTFTGTPITNTLTEIYHQMRYVMEEEMQKLNVAAWDGWFGSFATDITDIELSATGEYQLVTRLAGFVNVPELRKMIGQFMDIVFANDMPEMQPRKTKTGKVLSDEGLTEAEKAELLNGRTEGAKDRPYKKVINVTTEMSPKQEQTLAEIQSLAKEWERASGKEKRKWMRDGDPRAPLSISTAAKKASYDARIGDPEYVGKEGQTEDFEMSKASQVVKNVMEVYHSHPLASQVIFADTGYNTTTERSTGQKDDKGKTIRERVKVFSPIKDIVERLVQSGIPREQIAIVDGSVKAEARKAIADKVNTGEIRVVIGLTQTLGVGVNMQRNLRAMHHLDAPWMPGELEQRNGRGLRQGNQWNTVLEYRYITDKLDGKSWQVLAIKDRFINAFMKADGNVRSIEGDAAADNGEDNAGDIMSSFSEASGDPRVLQRIKMKEKLEKLQRKERLHTQGIADMKRTIGNTQRRIARFDEQIAEYENNAVLDRIQKLMQSQSENFSAEVDGKKYDKHKEASDAIQQFIADHVRTGSSRITLGKYGNVTMSVEWDSLQPQATLSMKIGPIEFKGNTLRGIEGKLRGVSQDIQAIEDAKASAQQTIDSLSKAVEQPFGQSDQLARTQKQLENIEQDLESNPVAPPIWLRRGTPIDSEVYYKGKLFVVSGHRYTNDGWFVSAEDAKGSLDIPYMEATDSVGMPIYEEREFEAPNINDKTKADNDVKNEINDYSRDKLKPDNERRGISPLDTTFNALSVVSATRRVLSVLQHLKLSATQDSSISGRITVGSAGIKGGFDVQVISSFDGLPTEIQKDATYQDDKGNTQNYDVSAVWHKGTLYVVADQVYGDNEKQITTFDAYEEMLAHEIIGHFGVQQIFGQEYKTKLQQLYNALGELEGIRKIASKNGVNMAQFESAYIEPYTQGVKDEIYTESDEQQALVGELFAFVAQNAKSRPFVRQKLKEVIGYIRQWFRDRGFDKFLSRYNDADLMMFLLEARKAVVDRSYFGKYKNQEFSSKNNSDTPLYSRRTKSNSGSTTQQVRDVLIDRFGKETIDELERQGKLEIIQDYQVEGVEGFYYNGKAVLVASNLTAESTVPTFLHELGGHAGFQNMMNQKQYNELMNQFNKLVEQGNPVALAAKMLAEREQGSERQQLEYLPYLLTLSSTMQQRNVIQRNALQKLINNIVSYVKAWVFDNFGINLNLNPDDMLALSERMIGQIKHQSSLDLIRQKYHGTNQWMTAPNGAKTHLSEQQWLQVRTPEFKKWFGDWENDAANASQVLDENGEPKVVYHGTASEFNEFKQGHGILGDGIYLTDSFDTADVYANIRGENGFVLPLFVNIRNAFKTTGNVSRDEVVEATTSGKYQGIVHQFENQEYIVALEPNQVKMAEGNKGTFNSESSDIRFSRSAKDIIDNLSKSLGNISISSVKDKTDDKKIDWLGIGLSALGRRQLTEIYAKLLPQLNKYNELAAQMDADKNDAGAEADNIVREWANLNDEEALADVMHDSTLAKIDPTKPYVSGDSISKYKQLRDAYNSLSPEAQAMYLKARDAYKKHYAEVHKAIKERILRSELSNQKKADLLKQMDDNFFGYVKGVYFPLARFGKYVVVMRNQNGEVESVSRAETMGEARALRSELMKKYPDFIVKKPKLDKEYNKSRDAVGRGFMSNLFDEVGNLGMDEEAQAEFKDTLGQLYLSSLPDLSWAKHGIHRKGTAGFSQNARRAFAQNMFSGANYLAKLRYGDQLAQQLDEMQKYADEKEKQDSSYDQPTAQSVIEEMNKRHDNLMNPKSSPLSSALTSLGFIYYLGLSPAAAMVNLSQTALVAYPIMGAKWGFDKAANELLKASNDFRKGVEFHKVKWEGSKTDLYKTISSDISKFLNKDEKQAYEDAVARGVIDVTQAHDLAGIAQGEDSGVMWKTRPIMRAASVMFHSAERFNREVTFIAAYRLARQSGENHDSAFDQAVDATYKGHFDYSSGNRPRIMQGNVAKVLLLFKQFGQNMLYTLARQTYQSIKGETEAERKEARKSLRAILAMHATFAGALGLPMVGMLLSVASWMGGDDDDPWDAEVALRNYLAEAFGPTISNMLMKGAPRGIGVDISGRVGINNLLLPDVQEGLEGKKWWDSASAAALGPIGGIGANIAKGAQEISEGHNLRGVESMLPVFLKNFAKTYRYADEGVQDKTGVSIMDEVSSMDLLVQGMGFSPSDVRTASEGKTAIYQLNRKLNERRSRLMALWSRAKMMDDQQEMDEIWEEIQGFNDKNPSRRITRMNLNQSYRNRQRRIDRAEDGIYLSRNRQDAREAGYFAFGE
ncbi:PLxRFG domain-containing protein [Acinetobacter colistiniresistens]|uniref:PLxRFG domain-containing protein n=1 Tax=Acinetobacter colistiniresistens TaxID=280145 RepID=UPI00211C26C7|nr:PLxRFG domain-containing protein [Acinetobacter colistiniresistens]UUM25970.1 PLxRFG domain-containing protein [Acinetobacter colistiniresistens]